MLSGLYDRLSYSLGQFHYSSAGFRPTNDLNHDVYTAFAQVAISPRFNVQAEYRHRNSDQGDRILNFNPNDFSTNERRPIEQDVGRVGLHFAPTPWSDVIGSFIYSGRTGAVHFAEDARNAKDQLVRNGFRVDEQSKTNGYEAEGQYLLRGDQANIVIGGGAFNVDFDNRTTIATPDDPTPSPGQPQLTNVESENAYFYSNLTFPSTVTWTLGVSYDLLNDKNLRLDTDKINYKLGLQWDITNALRLRAAAFETMKRLLIVDQTIEPTQVAGFNQFFDDFNATETQRYGIGIDARLTKKIYGGLEVSKRNLATPIIRSTGTTFDNQEEDLYRAYVYTMLNGDWTLSLEPQYERFASETNSTKLVKTLNVAITAQYFSESGFFANLRTSYVHQEVDVRPTNRFNETVENFAVVDAGFGYRLPKRRGILSFEVRNLLDEKFLFQDLGFRVSDPTSINPEFVSDRTILVRVTLDF